MSSFKEKGNLFRMLTQETQEWNFDSLKNVVVRLFTAGRNLLQPTGGVNRTPSHVTFFFFKNFFSMSHVTLVQGFLLVFHVSSAYCCCLDTLRFSSCSSSSSSLWVGSMRSPMRTSANEELGILAQNNLLATSALSYAVVARYGQAHQ